MAGVQMLESDDIQTRPNSAPKQGYYQDAIKSYVDILEKYPNSPDNAEVLYQLAKAYDIEGQSRNSRKMLERLVQRHPYFSNMSEVYFRLGDNYYNSSQYAKAQDAYYQTTISDGGKLMLNSHYMLAWSMYKQGVYEQSIGHFAYVLNDLLAAELNGRSLNKIEQGLVKDTLHSMSLALVNLGGAKAIEDIKILRNKTFIWRVYSNLAQFFIEKSRFDDSAVTYRDFIENHPLNVHSASFQVQLISAYEKGQFPELVLTEKEKYTNLYGPQSDYYQAHPSMQADINAVLKGYYSELASFYHSKGQVAFKKITKKTQHLKIVAQQSLTKATDFYGRYIQLFSEDKSIANLRYKKADAHFENSQFDLAAQEYTLAAYGKHTNKTTNKAAYASIVAFQKHIEVLTKEQASEEEMNKWHALSLESMLKFSEIYHQDKRSISVLTNAAQAMFALKQFDRAIEVASNLIEKTPKINNKLKQTAYGIIAHCYFQKTEYSLAKTNYLLQRKITAKKSSEYSTISNQIAASIYKTAENLKIEKLHKKAITELLSIKKIAPKSTIRVLAQYDAASLMLAVQNWDRAIKELTLLKKNAPKHELAKHFPRKLAFAYEKKQDWKKAATAYLQLSIHDVDGAIRQEALFIASGLFEKIGNDKKAIELYRDYAHKYEQPFDNRMEARFHLASLYEKQKDYTRQLFWLRRIVDGDQKAGDLATQRSHWLGAWANAKYGDYFAWEFSRRKLRMPIEQRLLKKNGYLNDATQRYEMAASYGILEFVSMSSFKIADMYEHFANELSKPPIPKGMAAQDVKVYKSILSEQAQPMYAQASAVYQGNIDLSWQGHFNEWIDKSFMAMRRLQPVRYNKIEEVARYGDEIR
jgi:tetratricopeptide (TPR) repeat protein